MNISDCPFCGKECFASPEPEMEDYLYCKCGYVAKQGRGCIAAHNDLCARLQQAKERSNDYFEQIYKTLCFAIALTRFGITIKDLESQNAALTAEVERLRRAVSKLSGIDMFNNIPEGKRHAVCQRCGKPTLVDKDISYGAIYCSFECSLD